MYFKPGIIQGRLLPPVDGHIQEFPKDNWEKEFEYISENKISHIEWIITKKSINEGVLDLDIKKYSNHISSICCDNLISENIYKESFLKYELEPICDFAIKNEIKKISIPLLEKSEIKENNLEAIIKMFVFYSNKYPGLDFVFESDSNPDLVKKLLESNEKFFFTYDTGNITSSGYNHEDYLKKVFRYTINIHLKDRTKNPITTVEPGNGDTNFKIIFDFLKKNNYNCIFTIQTARGESGFELNTILRHIDFFKKINEQKYF